MIKRETLFRGKSIDNGKWVYGDYAWGEIHIQPSCKEEWWGYEIIQETLGQFITKIGQYNVFDGDIFCIKHSKYKYIVKIKDDFQAICYHKSKLDIDNKTPLRWGPLHRIIELGWEKEFHIIGNMHDNDKIQP